MHGVGNIDRNLTFPRNVGVGRRSSEEAELKISDTFGKGLGSHGRDFVSQEGNFGNTENALGRVQKDAIILELGEEGADVLVVFLGERLKTRLSV